MVYNSPTAETEMWISALSHMCLSRKQRHLHEANIHRHLFYSTREKRSNERFTWLFCIIFSYWRDYQRFTPALYIHWTCGRMGSVSADWGVLHETLLFWWDECDYSRNDKFTFVHSSHLFSEGFVHRPVDGLWSAAL